METKPNNLSTFRTLYLIKGILTLCFSLFFMIYAGMGWFVNIAMEQDPNSPDLPFNFGWIFIIIGGIGILFCITLGILNLLASKYLKTTQNHNFIFAIAVVNCLTGILGILLGVFTLVELTKAEVKQLFENK